jgi:hypothetical protein
MHTQVSGAAVRCCAQVVVHTAHCDRFRCCRADQLWDGAKQVPLVAACCSCEQQLWADGSQARLSAVAWLVSACEQIAVDGRGSATCEQPHKQPPGWYDVQSGLFWREREHWHVCSGWSVWYAWCPAGSSC